MSDELISADDLLDIINSSQVRLEYVETKVSGTHVIEIHPDRRVRQFGVLWEQQS